MEINGIAHIILRASRFEDCVAFYDGLMPQMGLEAVFRGVDAEIGGSAQTLIRRDAPVFGGVWAADRRLLPN